MRLRILLISGISLLIVACANANPAGAPNATPTLVDPHHHVVDVNNNSLGPQNADEFSIKHTLIVPEQKRDNVTVNHAGTLQAFSMCDLSCHVLFEELATGQVYVIEAPSFLPGRPFSDLVWIADNILVFDQWTQPHHGVHYAIDVRAKTLILASPFPDEVP